MAVHGLTARRASLWLRSSWSNSKASDSKRWKKEKEITFYISQIQYRKIKRALTNLWQRERERNQRRERSRTWPRRVKTAGTTAGMHLLAVPHLNPNHLDLLSSRRSLRSTEWAEHSLDLDKMWQCSPQTCVFMSWSSGCPVFCIKRLTDFRHKELVEHIDSIKCIKQLLQKRDRVMCEMWTQTLEDMGSQSIQLFVRLPTVPRTVSHCSQLFFPALNFVPTQNPWL